MISITTYMYTSTHIRACVDVRTSAHSVNAPLELDSSIQTDCEVPAKEHARQVQ